MSPLERGPRSSGHRFKFWLWTRWDWARILFKFISCAVLISLLYSSFHFWLIPDPDDYPGVHFEYYPSAAIRDFVENRKDFFRNYKIAILYHIFSRNPLDILAWLLNLIALSLTFILPLKIYDILLGDVVQLGSKEYINLAMGSLLVGIILLASGTRTLPVKDRLYNAINILTISIVIFILERIRKSIIQ